VNEGATVATIDTRAPVDVVPRVASAREYLRSNVPEIYREDPSVFAMRFLGALERVLDPQVAILDCLAAYLSPQMAPPAMIEAMASWLGLPALDAAVARRQPDLDAPVARSLLSCAAQLARSRGTRAGLELALACCFPDLHFTVEDRGAVIVSCEEQPSASAYPGFLVSCEQSLSPGERAAVRRAIEWQCPLQVEYELREGTGTHGGAG
jgi:phage tail-like protein